MPNGIVAHAPDGVFDVEALKREAAALPDMAGLDLVPGVTTGQSFTWDETTWRLGEGYGRRDGEPAFHVVAIDYGIKRNILRLLADQGCTVTVLPATATAEDVLSRKPDGVFLSNGPGDPAATGEYSVPTIKAVVEAGVPTFGICLGHQMLGLALGGDDREDAAGPSRRQPSGEGFHHRKGRDRLDEPRLCARPREPAEERRGDACLALRRLELRHPHDRQAGVFRAVPSRRRRPARWTATISSSGSWG